MSQNKQLQSAWLILTNQCNLACSYCWVPSLKESMAPARMSAAVARLAIGFLNRYGAEGIHITLFGGEPLLEFNLIKTILSEFPYLDYTIYTNALLLDDEKIDFLYKRRDFVDLKISIDGSPIAQVGNRGRMYDEGLMKRVFNLFPTAEARLTIGNSTDCYRDVSYLKQKLGAKRISLKITSFLKLDQTRFDEIEFSLDRLRNDKELSKNVVISDGSVLKPCNVGSDYVAIAPNGDLYPCDVFYWLSKDRLGSIQEGWDYGALENFWKKLSIAEEKLCTSCIVEQMYFKKVAEHNARYFKGVCV